MFSLITLRASQLTNQDRSRLAAFAELTKLPKEQLPTFIFNLGGASLEVYKQYYEERLKQVVTNDELIALLTQIGDKWEQLLEQNSNIQELFKTKGLLKPEQLVIYNYKTGQLTDKLFIEKLRDKINELKLPNGHQVSFEEIKSCWEAFDGIQPNEIELLKQIASQLEANSHIKLLVFCNSNPMDINKIFQQIAQYVPTLINNITFITSFKHHRMFPQMSEEEVAYFCNEASLFDKKVDASNIQNKSNNPVYTLRDVPQTIESMIESPLAKILIAQYFLWREAQLDVIRLLYLAGVLDPETLTSDLTKCGYRAEEIQEVISVAMQAVNGSFLKKDLTCFSPEVILSKAFTKVTCNSEKLQRLHKWLIKVTQREFFARKPGEERWQQQTGAWMTMYETEIRPIVQRLNLPARVSPKKLCYDAILIFGSVASEMSKRLQYAKKLVDSDQVNTSRLYLLSGERPASKSIDGDEAHLNKVVEWINANKEAQEPSITTAQVTETHLMQAAYFELKKAGGAFASLQVIVIDAPKGDKLRPDTKDTLLAFVKHLGDSGVNVEQLQWDMLCISGAPHTWAQKETVETVFREKLPKSQFEVIGDSCADNLPLNRFIGAIGGAMFGAYVRVSREINPTLPNINPELLEQDLNDLKFVFDGSGIQVQAQGSTVQSDGKPSTPLKFSTPPSISDTKIKVEESNPENLVQACRAKQSPR